MDIIYKIYSVYLYDNQLDHEYLFLHSNRDHTGCGSLNYWLCDNLKAIYNMPDTPSKKEVSIKMMRDTIKNNNFDTLMVKNDGFLTIEKIKDTHDPRYSIYDIFWNETKSGINIFDYDFCSIWKPGASSYSNYRIHEEKHNRIKHIRDNKINQLINV